MSSRTELLVEAMNDLVEMNHLLDKHFKLISSLYNEEELEKLSTILSELCDDLNDVIIYDEFKDHREIIEILGLDYLNSSRLELEEKESN